MWRWMDSFGRFCHLLDSDSASHDSEKLLHHALRLQTKSYLAARCSLQGPQTGDVEVGPAWTIGLSKHCIFPVVVDKG